MVFEFQWCFEEVSRMFPGSFVGVSRKIEGVSSGSFRVVQGILKVISKKIYTTSLDLFFPFQIIVITVSETVTLS